METEPSTSRTPRAATHPEVDVRANLESISHRCHLFEVAFVGESTKETIHLPLGCLQGAACSGPLLVPLSQHAASCLSDAWQTTEMRLTLFGLTNKVRQGSFHARR